MPAESTGRRRIGLFGGTFDPPHIGHLVAAREVKQALDLDQVLLVVANEPWQKVGERPITPAETRLAMVRAAVADDPCLEASDAELVRGGPSYTVDTLEEFAEREPDAELFLILGSDAAARLSTWKRADELPSMCTLVVMERPGECSTVPEGFDPVHVPVTQLAISSTALREEVARGGSIRHLVPPGVISLIAEAGLYRDPR